MARKTAAAQPVKLVRDMTDEELEASMTPEEREYLDALHEDLEQGRIVPNMSEEEHARVRANAQYTLERLAQATQAPRERASKRVTVRVTPSDLATLHARAQELGLPPSLPKTACPESSPYRTPLKSSLAPSSASCPGRAGPRCAWRWGAPAGLPRRAGHAGRAMDGVWPPAGGAGGRAAGWRRQKAV